MLTVQELIRYHKKISRSDRVYEMTCGVWDQILRFYRASVDFRSLMDRVGKMSDEKPVRLKLSIRELSVEVDADAAIAQMHRFFVRVARELHQGLRQKKKGAEPTQPIHQQLRAADDWMSMVTALLTRYKEGFGGARANVRGSSAISHWGVVPPPLPPYTLAPLLLSLYTQRSHLPSTPYPHTYTHTAGHIAATRRPSPSHGPGPVL